jgi:predicted amidophosphoribosyltransferase
VLAVGRYTGPLRTGLLRYKERGRRDLAGPLAALLATALHEVIGAAAPGGPVLRLVPAPSQAVAARARGGDHVARICRALAAQRPDVRVARPLRLSRGVRDSVGLDAVERAANLAGGVHVRRAAALRGQLTRGPVVLVDDVVTTGATLRACWSALADAGVPVTAAVVLCDATPRGHDH